MVRRPPLPDSLRRVAGALVAACVAFGARGAAAQAFLPPAGEGTVTAAYHVGLARGHTNNWGQLTDEDRLRSHAIAWEVEFGLNERVALSVSVPFITSRYAGPSPHPVTIRGEPSDLDDGTYHGGFQDFRFGGRVNVIARPLAVTPFAEVIVPSHEYEALGHAAIGLNLRALVAGVAVGGFVDLLPGTYFHSQVSHAVVEEILGVRPNRTRVDGEVGYFVTPRFAVRFLGSYQFTHDGWDFIQIPGAPEPDRFSPLWIHSRRDEPITLEHRRNHDRLMRSNFVNLGGGLTVGVTDSISLFATVATTTWSRNFHPLRGLSVGTNLHFRARRGAPSPASAPARRLARVF